METWAIVISAMTAGLGLLITAVIVGIKDTITVWFQQLHKRIKKKTYVQQVEKLAEFLEIFEGIKKIPEIQRCLVLTGHNCGGLPTPGKPYTVRAIHGWATKEGKPNPLEKYNFELQVDVHYIRALEDVIKKGISEQEFHLMPQDAKLKMLYEIDGVKYAQMHYLGIIEEELLFLSASTYDGTVFGHDTCVQLRWAVDRMKSTISE